MSKCCGVCGKYAVFAQNLCFGYGNGNIVLDNLSIRIEQGKIFALLGSNGCGKTTLLKLVLGRTQPHSGKVLVFGKQPGHKGSLVPGPIVGYMPQEISLFPEFTIEENLNYFAKLFHINCQQFEERFKYLTEFLNLSQKNRRVDQLSGGQQRLVSMAVAILHKPRLIILDEPTVGVDPILRTRIWSYLEDTCRENGNTVIITTHYIEEAKRASNVGFMKSGAILRQSDPQKLMTEYKCSTLEAVYFHLWNKKHHKIKDELSPEVNSLLNESDMNSNMNSNFISSKRVDFPRIETLIGAFALRLRKLPILFLCFIAIPFLSVFSLYLAVGHLPHDIPVAVYSDEVQPILSQYFIDSIDHNFLDVSQYMSKEKAIDSIVEGRNAFAIFFDKNFTKNLESRLCQPFGMRGKESNKSLISLYTDSSRAVVLGYGLQYLAEVSLQFVSNVSLSLGLNSNAYTLPLTIEKPIYGSHPIWSDHNHKFRENYHYLTPAFLMVTFHLTAMILSALSFIIYRSDSQLDRYFMAGGHPFEFIVAHYISKTIYISIQIFFLLVCSSLLFNVKQEGSYIEVYLICFMQALQGVSMGLLMSIPFKRELTIGVVAMAVMAPLYFISGIFWPLEGIPSYFRAFSDWSPLSKPVDAIRSIMLRGWDYRHPTVFNGYVVSFSFTLIISTINVILFQIRQEPFF